MPKIKFVLITKNNINLAIKTVTEIFPYEISSKGLYLPAEEYKLAVSVRSNTTQFFIVKYGQEIVGVTGYNYHYHIPNNNELWLGYFGLKEKYRGNGLGKKILLQTVELMKEFNVNLRTIKLYTTNRVEEKGSHHLYRCVGFKLYAHKNTVPFHTYYYKFQVR